MSIPPRRIKAAKVYIDRYGRLTFLLPNESPPEDEWWQSVLADPRAGRRPSVNDTMLGNYAAMFVEIFCENCHRHDVKAVDDLRVMYGDRCAVAQAVNAQVNCRRSAKRCAVDFKIRQWEEVAKLRQQ